MDNDRRGWLRDISLHLGLTSRWEEIDSVPELRAYLKRVWGKVPRDCGSLEALEAIAFALGVPGAEEKPLVFQEKMSEKSQKWSNNRKAKLSDEEMLDLRRQRFSYQRIAELAGISRQRVQQILKHISS